MLASYAKIKPPLDTYERGFVEWDDDAAEFRKLGTFPVDAPIRPEGHPLYVPAAGSGEPDRVYFAQPLPLVRVEAMPEAYLDLDRYEAFTCLKPGSRAESSRSSATARDGRSTAGSGTRPPTGPAEQAALRKAGLLKEEEQLHAFRDIETGKPVQAHGGSVWQLPCRRRPSPAATP